MSAVRLAIVGSTAFGNGLASSDEIAEAEDLIATAIARHLPDVVISGGAQGIDTMAARIARAVDIKVIEHLPTHRRWAPDGYQDRNLLIARDCTHLVAIRHAASTTYGSGWTADRAAEMGKPVKRYTVPSKAAS